MGAWVASPHYPRRVRPSSILPRSQSLNSRWEASGGPHVEEPPSQEQGLGKDTKGLSPRAAVSTSGSSAVVLGQGRGFPQRPFVQIPVWALPKGPGSAPAGPRQDTAQSLGGSGSRSDFPPSASCSTYLVPQGLEKGSPPPPPAPAESGQPGTGPGGLVPSGKF